MIIFVFFICLAFWLFPRQRQPFWKNQPLTAQLHMAYDIPTRCHKVWSRHLREMCLKNICGRKTRIAISSNQADITPPHYFGTLVSMVMPFWIFSTRQKLPHTMVNIPTIFHEVSRKKSKIKKKIFFYIHGNCGKVCPTDSDFFGLSRSTRCGCCPYQVSSISVRSYDVSWSLMKEI